MLNRRGAVSASVDVQMLRLSETGEEEPETPPPAPKPKLEKAKGGKNVTDLLRDKIAKRDKEDRKRMSGSWPLRDTFETKSTIHIISSYTCT